MPPTYRNRLRLEGAWLAACGTAGSVGLLVATDEAHRWPLNTAGQLIAAAALTAWYAPRGARKALEQAEDREPADLGGGEPTPLWMHPLIVAGLAAVGPALREAGVRGVGWDLSLRFTAGCTIVGLVQAIAMERVVAAAERDNGRTYYRAKGSRGSRTVLVATPTAAG